jgi:hypothetical protein
MLVVIEKRGCADWEIRYHLFCGRKQKTCGRGACRRSDGAEELAAVIHRDSGKGLFVVAEGRSGAVRTSREMRVRFTMERI